MKEDDKRPFAAHLEELRNRLIKSFIAVGVGFVLSYAFKEKLFQILTAPLISVMETGETLIYTNLPEAFFTFLKTAFLSGILLASLEHTFCGRGAFRLFCCLSLGIQVFSGVCLGNRQTPAVHERISQLLFQAASGIWSGI